VSDAVLPSRGTCFGFDVRSTEPLAYLRHGTGEPLRVSTVVHRGRPSRETLLSWRKPADPYRASLYRDGDAFRLWIGGGGWYVVDPARGAIDMPAGGDVLRREERLWGIPALLCFRRRGDLPLHAAAVEVGGAAVLLAGPRMAGKTTLAAAFHRAGHRVLAEDLTCIRVGDHPAVIPGPAMLRVRHDAAAGLGLAHDAAHPRSRDRVHVAIDPARRGDCTPVPLAGVALLRIGDEIHMREADVHDAVRDLWGLNFRLPTDDDRAASFGAIADVVSRVRVWDLRRPIAFDALDDVVAHIVDRVEAFEAVV